MKRYFILPVGLLSLLICATGFAADQNTLIRQADVAMIQAVERANPNNSFAENKKFFFQEGHSNVAIEEKTIEEILNMPENIAGVISINQILAPKIKDGQALDLSESEYIYKLRSILGISKNQIAAAPKNWTYVAEHSRIGASK